MGTAVRQAAAAVLLAGGLLVQVLPATAVVVREGATRRPDSGPEVGGQRPGTTSTPGVACSPLPVAAWLSFPPPGQNPGQNPGPNPGQNPGDARGAVVVPFGNNAASCALGSDQAYLLQAAAAIRDAIVGDRLVAWRVGRTRGFVRPGRSFLAAGVTCRNFVHTLNFGHRRQVGPGTACLHAGGWRIQPPIW